MELTEQLDGSRVEVRLAGSDAELVVVRDEPEWQAPGDDDNERPHLAAPPGGAEDAGRGGCRRRRRLDQCLARPHDCRPPRQPRPPTAREPAARFRPELTAPATTKGAPHDTYETPDNVRLDLSVAAGAIELQTEERETTTVELEPMSGDAQALIDATEIECREESGGHRIRVKVPHNKNLWQKLTPRR